MKIAIFDLDNEKKDFFQDILKKNDVQYFHQPLTKEIAANVSDCQIISIRIHSKITEEILALLPNLKCITTQSTGFDHIDLKACQSRGINVCNVPLYGEYTVAEHTFALILALSRNVHKSYVRTIKGDLSTEGLRGFDLQGKTLGVIGTGHIGLHVIRIAKAFSMKVLAFDVAQNDFLADVLGFSYKSFDEVLASSDIITLHLPHNKHTHHLINEKALRKMKPGALLINTARGKIIDTEALAKALDENILAGAALDVIEKEEHLIQADKDDEIIRKHPLLFRDNVVYTPHIASHSKEAQERILQTTADNMLNFIEEKPTNFV
jgi:D-lactate dehydrogenase